MIQCIFTGHDPSATGFPTNNQETPESSSSSNQGSSESSTSEASSNASSTESEVKLEPEEGRAFFVL